MRDAATTNVGLLLGGVCAATVFCVLTDTPVDPPAPRELATAVTSTGFAVLDGTPADRHVIEVGRDGGASTRRAVPVVAPEARMVGAAVGVVVGWRDGRKVKLATVTGDGTLGEPSTWGSRVQHLCDGTASNLHRWGISWMESDGRQWVVHGPTKRGQGVFTADAAVSADATAKTVWCGVTSAGQNLMLLWRNHKNDLHLMQCSAKRCEPKELGIKLGKATQLGVGCTFDECLIAARDAGGEARLAWLSWSTGKLLWTKPLQGEAGSTAMSIVAVGEHAFAVGHVTREGAVVTRVIGNGSMVRAWADPYSQEAPVLAWAEGRLLAAHRHGDGVAPEVVQLPE